MKETLTSEPVPTFTELDYIANELYQSDSMARRGTPGVRWWCAREDLRQKWRLEARSRFLAWSQSEQRMWDQREKWDD